MILTLFYGFRLIASIQDVFLKICVIVRILRHLNHNSIGVKYSLIVLGEGYFYHVSVLTSFWYFQALEDMMSDLM